MPVYQRVNLRNQGQQSAEAVVTRIRRSGMQVAGPKVVQEWSGWPTEMVIYPYWVFISIYRSYEKSIENHHIILYLGREM